MNIIKEMEQIIKLFTGCDNLAANLSANGILDKFDELGLDVTKKEVEEEAEALIHCLDCDRKKS